MRVAGVIIVPDFIRRYRHFSIFYKIEQAGERLHAQFNEMERNMVAVKPVKRRYFLMVKKFEEKHKADLDIGKKTKRNFKRKLALSENEQLKKKRT